MRFLVVRDPAIWAARTVLNVSAILLKYQGAFFIFSWEKTNCVHCSAHTKKLINLKVRKMSILALSFNYLDQNRVKTGFSNLSVCQYGLLILGI